MENFEYTVAEKALHEMFERLVPLAGECETVAEIIENIWGIRYKDDAMNDLASAVYEFLTKNPDLETTKNDEDMWDYTDDEDTYDCWDDEDDDDWYSDCEYEDDFIDYGDCEDDSDY